MKFIKPPKVAASQLVTAKDLQAMLAYLKNFDLKYSRGKIQEAIKKQ